MILSIPHLLLTLMIIDKSDNTHKITKLLNLNDKLFEILNVNVFRFSFIIININYYYNIYEQLLKSEAEDVKTNSATSPLQQTRQIEFLITCTLPPTYSMYHSEG